MLFSITAFLVVLAVLMHQLPAANHGRSHPALLLRKVYRTTIIVTIAGGSGPLGTSVLRSVSSSGSSVTATAPTTRSS